MSQQQTHRYALEASTGVPAARAEAGRLIRLGFGLSLVAALAVLLLAAWTSQDFDSSLLLGGGLVVAGLPFGVLAQRYTSRLSLNRGNLRLSRFLIGRKEYLVPKKGVLSEELSLFAAACSLVCDDSAIRPGSQAVSWQSHRTFDELPGLAVSFGTFGPTGRPYAFVYGNPKDILAHTGDIWDLGHVRPLTAADRTQLKSTASTWKHRSSIPLALAYAALPPDTDTDSLTSGEITKELTLLGLLGLSGTREYGKPFPLAPASALRTSASAGFIGTLSILGLGILSYLGLVLFSIPPAIGFVHILVLKLAVEALPAAALTWDHAGPVKKPTAFSRRQLDAMWAGFLVSILAYMNYLLYFGRHNFGLDTVTAGSASQRGAMALGLLTLGLCLLAAIVLLRGHGTLASRYALHNPLFMLGLASALLTLCIAAYATGPLVTSDLWFAGGAVALFIFVREMQTYANKHHTRDHILELLRSN